jgi:hypothetical protein
VCFVWGPSLQTYRTISSKSLFSRASSKTLNDVAEADANRHRLVHHLAWAFDHGGRSYIMVYELSQWCALSAPLSILVLLEPFENFAATTCSFILLGCEIWGLTTYLDLKGV